MKNEFSNIYDFYKLSNEEAYSLIGQIVYEIRIIKKGRQRHKIIEEYIPIGLKNEWTNYGYPVGLLYVTEVKYLKYEKNPRNWFKVGVFSPDDLDLCLDFYDEEVKLRSLIKEYLLSLPLYDTDYHEILKTIQEKFNAGQIGS